MPQGERAQAPATGTAGEWIAEESALVDAVRGLRAAREDWRGSNERHAEYGAHGFPSRHAVARIIDMLAATLFPIRLGPPELTPQTEDAFILASLQSALPLLAAQVRMELFYEHGDADELAVGRIAHELHRLGAPLVARIIAEIAHSRTGIDIHPGATIGAAFFIDHGTGVVLGQTAIIGRRVRIYQAVTLGARSFSSDAEGKLVKDEPRHPIVEDDVTIYAGATVLGRITIGAGSIIGGNVWLTRSVPAGSRVRQPQPNVSIELGDPFE